VGKRIAQTSGKVVDLSGVRARLRLTSYGGKVGRALDGNERALQALFGTGHLFTRPGAQVGRNLLLARQYLLKVASLLRRLADEGEVPAPRLEKQITAVYDEVNTLLERSATLVERASPFLKQLSRPVR
jgi:hypothetical protein